MRIWDLPPKKLCREHLLGEHRELHAIWSILTKGKKGYSKHPETMRWRGRLKALFLRHKALIMELKKRGYRHNSPLDWRLAKGAKKQVKYLIKPSEQVKILRKKGCNCKF